MAHWKEHLGSELLGAYSLWSDEKNDFAERDGIITHFGSGKYNLGVSGRQECFVGYTNLGKPIKINTTIAKCLAAIVGTHNLDTAKNVSVTFYVDRNVKSKDGICEAIRVKRCINAPKTDHSAFNAQLESCTTLAELQATYKSFSPEIQGATKHVKDIMKGKLS